jgi:hypothetical protein
MLRVALGVLLCLGTVAEVASAQSLTQSPFVVGQPVSLAITGAQPGDTVALFAGFSGLGAGPCVPQYNACFALNLPWTVLFVLPADAQGSVAVSGVLPSALPLVPVFTQAAVLHGATLTPTQALATMIEPVSVLSDDFESPTLAASWTVHNGALMTHALQGGALELEPIQTGPTSIWFNDHEGPAVLKPITGDFDVRATVHVFDPAAPNQVRRRDAARRPAVPGGQRSLARTEDRAAERMDRLGIHTANLGLPGAGGRPREDILKLARHIAEEAAAHRRQRRLPHGRQRHRAGRRDDAEAGIPIEVCAFIGSSYIRQYAEDWTLDRMLQNTREALTFAQKHNLPVMYVTEDTTRARPETSRRSTRLAIELGARACASATPSATRRPQGTRAW